MICQRCQKEKDFDEFEANGICRDCDQFIDDLNRQGQELVKEFKEKGLKLQIPENSKPA